MRAATGADTETLLATFLVSFLAIAFFPAFFVVASPPATGVTLTATCSPSRALRNASSVSVVGESAASYSSVLPLEKECGNR
ncbi:hypothetical protein V5799_006756 [Amblyomma americanum]|uniref:Uncharacterized protein n=1 Tax=Amblyomma americanum TaxID=6943 RepID=A0AAQ4DVH3_AMBAM